MSSNRKKKGDEFTGFEILCGHNLELQSACFFSADLQDENNSLNLSGLICIHRNVLLVRLSLHCSLSEKSNVNLLTYFKEEVIKRDPPPDSS